MTLTNATAIPTLAVTNLNQAKQFYENKVGLEHVETVPKLNQALYKCGNTYVCIHERPEAPKSPATVCSFEVEDVARNVERLRNNGIEFQDLDIPEMGIKTKNGIASMGDFQTAWFTDPWGNILAIDDVVTKTGRTVHPTT